MRPPLTQPQSVKLREVLSEIKGFVGFEIGLSLAFIILKAKYEYNLKGPEAGA